MTWNPRKKNYLNLKPSLAPPLLSVTEDRDLNLAVQRLMHVEATIRKLTKETKRYLEAITNLDRADQRLTTNLSACELIHINDEFRHIVEEYLTITTQVGKTVQDVNLLSHKTFIEPLKKLRDEFALIAEALAKREEIVNTWRTAHNRLKKLQEKKDKTASHVVKLEREKRAEEAAAKELKSIHSRLLVELPWFLEKRLDYIKPSINALIMIQLDYYGNTMKLFNQLMPLGNYTSDDEDALVNEQFTRIKSLTIVKDH
ncbi:GSCOCG00006967001-RA-CDS [Cotesia congregata]|uniref:Similar to bin3: Bridging integrator 3 homolog (Xenopus laevis) n=1 Tax=Cotesia congregata TaxID=51543 RepID=A0A8J2HIS6_COTCN|nr:GSCOCG00006967001-RA-CDS [Cotesia congregata]CAG5092660.1 Similar to bin3: Bridging integrator 3 homolog (Xenopus laevis) [Cotesia congregata]